MAVALGSFKEKKKRGNEERKTRVIVKFHDPGQEKPFLEHHVQYQKGGADLEKNQQSQRGKEEEVELSSVVPES